MSTREELEKRRSGLPAAKQVLLEKRKQRIASLALAERPDIIPQRPQGALTPASFAQQRFWFIHQLKPNNAAYNDFRTIRVQAQLDLPMFQRTLLEMLRRHDLLRSNVVFLDGQLQQIIQPYEEAAAALSLHEIDLTHTPANEREQAAQRAIEAEIKRPFDLASGFLWRPILIHMGEADTIFVSVIHHILCDGWGLDIFERELQTLYLAFQAGQPSPLPDPQLQYADFAYWEHQRSRHDLWQQQLSYWKQTLADLSDEPLLFGDHPRHSLQRTEKASFPFTVPASVTQLIRTISSREGVTPFMIVLATLQLLLSQYSGQDDIVVGTPISRRSRPELEPLIGCFINLLVLRTNLSGNPTFQDLLQRVRASSLGAYAHQELPFEQLVAELAPGREKNRNPFFQIMLDFQNYQQTAPKPSKSHPTALNVAADVSQFDLILGLWDNGEELLGEFFYPSDLFNPSTVEGMRDRFLSLLTSVTSEPTQPLSEIVPLSEAERQIIATWQTAQIDAARERHALLAFDQEHASEEDETAPRTPLEEILVEVWTQVLGIEWVGIHDNFFKIGGHSLLATQLLTQVQQVLDLEIPLQLVFDAPTIAEFAEALLKDASTQERVERTIELLLSVTELSEDEVAAMLVES